MAETLFGIFHTAYERAGEYFYKAVNGGFINTIIVESNYKSEEFAKSMDELVNHPEIKVWVLVTYLAFKSQTRTTIADNGEQNSVFNPKTKFLKNFRSNVNEFVEYLKQKGWYDSVIGFYMDEPLLWNIKNEELKEFTRYFRTIAAPQKRFFICFSVAGVAPEYWTTNNVRPITQELIVCCNTF